MQGIISKSAGVAIMLLIVCSLLLSSTVVRTSYVSASGRPEASLVGYDYTATIDWLHVYRSRSHKGDNDWMVYEVRVVRDGNQVFYDKRDGQLTMDKPLTSIQGGDEIGLTDRQGRWSNPFVIEFQLESSDVVIGTYTVVNQSHENYDPDKQRKKWDKFVSTEEKAVSVAKLIALPIGVGPLVDTITDIGTAILKTIGTVWDLVSPPLGHDVNCDGLVLSGYWKYTAADLLRVTNNTRRAHNFSDREISPDKPASECGSPPDTEIHFSIVRGLNMVGNFGSGPSPNAKTTFKPITGAPPEAWKGERVEHIYVKDSKYDVRIEASRAHAVLGDRRPSYKVSVRELAAPGSAQVVFQTEAQGLEPTPTQLPGRSSRGGTTFGLATTDALQVGNGVTLYIFAAYSNDQIIDYAVRYVRQANGSTATDVMLRQAQKPLQ